MKRWFLWILLLPFFGTAQKFTAADMKQMKLFTTGIFKQAATVSADTQAVQPSLTIQPIWSKRKDGVWLFADKADSIRSYQVWHYYLQDDSTLLLQFFTFKNQQKALQLANDIRTQSELYINELFTSHGCDIYLKKIKTGFTGGTFGKDCFTTTPGTEYMVSNITITKDGISWQQTQYDKENKEVPAASNGTVKYVKAAKPKK